VVRSVELAAVGATRARRGEEAGLAAKPRRSRLRRDRRPPGCPPEDNEVEEAAGAVAPEVLPPASSAARLPGRTVADVNAGDPLPEPVARRPDDQGPWRHRRDSGRERARQQRRTQQRHPRLTLNLLAAHRDPRRDRHSRTGAKASGTGGSIAPLLELEAEAAMPATAVRRAATPSARLGRRVTITVRASERKRSRGREAGAGVSHVIGRRCGLS